jgi:hypothetical protein
MPALVELTYHFRISQVPPASATATTTMAATAGASSLSLNGTEPPPKKARSRDCMPLSSWYVCVPVCTFCDLSLLSLFLSSKKVFSKLQEAGGGTDGERRYPY